CTSTYRPILAASGKVTAGRATRAGTRFVLALAGSRDDGKWLVAPDPHDGATGGFKIPPRPDKCQPAPNGKSSCARAESLNSSAVSADACSSSAEP
ncbi:MAG TPA: hypothetical protein VLN58_13755, partial [Verrucomicrobiae bacterium]|nr:hypothetical protein [Verrucomicrobiae bacterium]